MAKTIENKRKEQWFRFLNMLFGTLGDSLLGNLFSNKGVIWSDNGVIRGGQNF